MANRLLSALALIPLLASAENNGFGRTPIMGYNTYNDVACSPNQTYVTDTIDSLHNRGLIASGYKMFQVRQSPDDVHFIFTLANRYVD